MFGKSRKIKTIFLVYWFLLLYVLAALIWWYIALSRQNEDIFKHRVAELSQTSAAYQHQFQQLEQRKNIKRTQYTGEGVIFFILIGAGAIFLYRAVKKQLQLSEQQKNFMMAVTHELKTPIAVTKLNLETLQKRKLDDLQQQRLLQHALDETNRMNALCNNLLISSQMESGRYVLALEDVQMHEAIREIIRDFMIRFPDRKVIADQPEPFQMKTDVFLLQILLNNLLHNAHKYSPKGQPIEINLEQSSDGVMLLIKDYGKGIPPEERPHVFEKFYRLNTASEKQVNGTGLGLYIAKRITELLQIHIQVEENKPTGSVFSLRFNLTNEHVG